MKQCSLCREDKPYIEFYIDRSKPTGRTAYCKECSDYKKAQWKLNHPEHYRQWRLQAYVQNREKWIEYYRALRRQKRAEKKKAK